mmetsp:Transcript_30563/g.69935  ORF Transcript_30563/g.69935 Transcript_30563/m.69935 type:complete len:100 (+) Transcript_30563:831-1130(+)
MKDSKKVMRKGQDLASSSMEASAAAESSVSGADVGVGVGASVGAVADATGAISILPARNVAGGHVPTAASAEGAGMSLSSASCCGGTSARCATLSVTVA